MMFFFLSPLIPISIVCLTFLICLGILSGVIVIGSRNNERIIDRPLETLNKENVSAIVTSSRAADLLLTKHFNVFTTALDIASVTEVRLHFFSLTTRHPLSWQCSGSVISDIPD